jgi:DNA-binding SARP family transcriptional activator
VAEAGYGKTTLLADFARQSELRTLWYRLDSTDADPITWANYLIAAAREHEPTFGKATESLLAQVANGSPDQRVLVRSLIGDLTLLSGTSTLLILDDFHLVDVNQDVKDVVSELIRNGPEFVRVVISTRRRPGLALGRLASMGELAEVATNDLRFSPVETESLFHRVYGQQLDADVLGEVDEKTKGWIASLQLFHGSTQGKSKFAVKALATTLSGAKGPIYDLLAEEVLASTTTELADLLMRASVMDQFDEASVHAVLDTASQQSFENTSTLISQAEHLGFVSRTSEGSSARQLHPLFRDFLLDQLRARMDADQMRQLHLRIASAFRSRDPLAASRHFIEAGDFVAAMELLDASVLDTMGSGQWGVACELVNRLRGVSMTPSVAAIGARRLIEMGDLAGAERLLTALDLDSLPPAQRAVVRQTTLTLGWRTGDQELLYRTLQSIDNDPDTPRILRDIAQVFLDSSELANPPATLADLGRRLMEMAVRQRQSNHYFYAAVSSHNAAIAFLNAGRYDDCMRAATDALATFDRLNFDVPERNSTYSVMAMCSMELGLTDQAEDCAAQALSSHQEFADVPAELALMFAALGDRDRATELLHRADELRRDGRTDVLGNAITDGARAFLQLATQPAAAALTYQSPAFAGPLDLGHNLARAALLAQSHVLARDVDAALSTTRTALVAANARGARRATARLEIIDALASRDGERLRHTVRVGSSVGNMTLHELADVICDGLDLLPVRPKEIEDAVAERPSRWLPALRRQLDRGNVASGHAAARLLDQFGELADVPRLRAYARTYRRKGAWANLGIALAHRVSPKLRIHDLGRTQLTIGTRELALTAVRRKPATLLMYLVTRPAFSANREQVLDALWPDADPASSSNSLNQSLYFLRREIDPWHDDGVSADYVGLEGDVVWLDQSLTSSDSAAFLSRAAHARGIPGDTSAVLDALRMYVGPFAPEFEYEEWAIEWRARLTSALVSLASLSVKQLIRDEDLEGARDVAATAWERDPTAADLERQLIWLYWRLGSFSSAKAHFEHLNRLETDDDSSPTLDEIVEASEP